MVGVRSQTTLGDYLVRENIITQAQFHQALEEQANNSRSIGRILVDRGFIDEDTRILLLTRRFGFDLVSLKDLRVEPLLLLLIPHGFAEKHHVVPIRREEDKTLVVAMEDPSDAMVLEAMHVQLGVRIKPVLATHEDIQRVLNMYARQKEIREARAEAARPLLRTILSYVFLPVMLLFPPAFLFWAWQTDAFAIRIQVNYWFKNNVVGPGDLALYLALAWVAWAFVMYELNGMLFGKKRTEAEEE